VKKNSSPHEEAIKIDPNNFSCWYMKEFIFPTKWVVIIMRYLYITSSWRQTRTTFRLL